MVEKKKIQYRAIVPNIFTIGNMFCGFTSIVYSFKGEFTTAFWLIVVGGLFDALDGKIARFLDTSSDFGVEYDSLSDVITFGVAPSLMLYNAFYYQMSIPGFLLAFLPLLFGSIRLARFNVELEGFTKEEFSGLPIPIAAITIASGVVFWVRNIPPDMKYLHWFSGIMIIVSFLMVTRFRYPSLPNFRLKHARPSDRVAFLVLLIALVMVLVWKDKALFPVMVGISLSGVFAWFFEWFKEGGKRINNN